MASMMNSAPLMASPLEFRQYTFPWSEEKPQEKKNTFAKIRKYIFALHENQKKKIIYYNAIPLFRYTYVAFTLFEDRTPR